jgi:general stress protein 26
MNQESLNEIKLLLAAKERPVVFLATVDSEGKPRVRPLNLMSTPRGFYIATSRKSRKIRELKSSDAVEMVTIFPTEKGTGYLRIAGKAKEVKGQEKRSTIEETHYPVEKYWNGVDDPDFMVLRIDPERVEYIRPGEDDPMDVTATFSRSTR